MCEVEMRECSQEELDIPEGHITLRELLSGCFEVYGLKPEPDAITQWLACMADYSGEDIRLALFAHMREDSDNAPVPFMLKIRLMGGMIGSGRKH